MSSPACVEYYAPEAAHSFRCGPSGVCAMHVIVPPGMASFEVAGGRAIDLELDPSRCLGLAAALCREVSGRADALTAESLAFELLAEASRWPLGPRGRAGWIDGVIDELRSVRGRGPTLCGLAAERGLHPGHVAREFRRETGVSVGEYSRRLRLADAARLIGAGRESLARVAHECGFSDQAHLSNRFKRHTGLTPRGLRRLLERAAAPTA